MFRVKRNIVNYYFEKLAKLLKMIFYLFTYRFFIALLSLLLVAEAYTQTYSTPGTFFFTVPVGVTQIKVECWGAGGAGGGNTTNADGGGGGGGGAYSQSFLSVIPNNTYTVTVGTGGVGSTGNGTDGGDTWFGSVGTAMAQGGAGGYAPVSGNGGIGGTGGLAAGSVGNIIYSGGSGGTGRNNNTGRGGPGGSSAGYTSDGISGSNPFSGTIAGTPPFGGGSGGDGGGATQNGQSGSDPGGGGGGSGDGNRSGGNGAGGRIVITLPPVVTLSSSNQVVASNVYQSTQRVPLFSFSTAIGTSNALLNSLSFTTAGSYIATDLNHFQLWYNTADNFATATQIGSDITTGLGAGAHTFTGLAQTTNAGITGYFWITTDIANNANVGNTISVNSLSASNLVYELAMFTGSTTSGGVKSIIAIPNVTLNSSNPAVAVANLNQGGTNAIVYSFSTAITNANATLNDITFITTGTCTSVDITNFRLWYNTSNDFSTAVQRGSDIISGLSAGSHTFTGLALSASAGSTGYFWITVDVSAFPTNSRTLGVSAITTAGLSYSIALKSGAAYNGGTQTIQVLSGIMLTTTNPAVNANSVLQGSVKQNVYKFATLITGSNATLNTVTFNTAGTYNASDIVNFQLWYNTVNSLVTATQISTITAGLGVGAHSFSGLSQVTNDGNTGYFWITADIQLAAIPGRTLQINAITTADLVYASGNKYGTANFGGIQTIQLRIDSDGDGVADLYDIDDDNDGIPDLAENAPCNTSALELFPNSDFSLGNIGFASALNYLAPAGQGTLYPEGAYTIVTNPNSVHNHFSACGDHTTGTGNMMVINADGIPNRIVWSSGNIAVAPNTDYTLSLYLSSVHASNPAQIIFNVNSENIGVQFNALSTTCNWVYGVAYWNSGSATSATFNIINLNLAAGGNDFALDDISCKYRINCNQDADFLPDKLDLDSDNDGIFDIIEAGGADANLNGRVDGFTDTDGDGLSDNVDNIDAGSGAGEVFNGTGLANTDTDSDGLPNRSDLDSDNDNCFDVREAGFTDGNFDGIIGGSPVNVDNITGTVTGAGGYILPADANTDATFDFLQRIPFISNQPTNANICLTSTTNTSFAVTAVNTGGTYQWQVSTDNGNSWATITNGGVYSGATSATLVLTGISATYDLYQYRLQLSNIAYVCSPLNSDAAVLRAFNGTPTQPGIITGLTSICSSINSNYSIAPNPATLTYNWTVPAGWVINGGNGTTTLNTTSSASSGNIAVSASNTCGVSPVRTLAVTVGVPAPTFISSPPSPSCQSVSLTYTTQAGMSNYIWTISGSPGSDYIIESGGGISDNSLAVRWISTGSKTVTVNYSNGGCAGVTPASSTITINPNAIVLTQPVNPISICANSGISTFEVTAAGATGYQWQESVDGGTNWSNIANTTPYSGVTTSVLTITNPSAIYNSYRYRCIVTGTCGNVTSNGAILSVDATIITSESLTGQTQCLGGTFAPISVVATGPGISYQWFINSSASNVGGTSLGSSNGAQTGTYTPQASVSGTVYYYCEISGSCGNATSNVSGAIVVLPENTISLSSGIGSDGQSVCEGLMIAEIRYTTTGVTAASFSGLPAGVSGNWAANEGIISGTPSTTGSYSYTMTLTGGCGTVNATGGITVNTLPTVNLGPDFDICSGNTAVIDAGAGYSTYSWTTGAGTQTITVGTANTYGVTITDGNGCQGTDAVVVTVITTPPANTIIY